MLGGGGERLGPEIHPGAARGIYTGAGGQPPAGDPPAKGADEGTKHVPAAELDKALAAREAAEKKSRELSAQIAAMSADKAKTEASLASLGADPAKIAEELAALRKQNEDAKLKDASELEKALHENKKLKGLLEESIGKKDKELAEVTTAREQEKAEAAKQLAAVRDVQLTNSIMSAALANSAYDPEQIVRMLRGEFKYDDVNAKHVFEYAGRGDAVHTKTVDERVKDFLADEKNKNLVRVGGSGPRPGAQPGTGGGYGSPASGTPPAAGEKFSVDKDGFMSLGRELTVTEKRDAEGSGLDPKEYADKLARMFKAQEANEKRSRENAKSGPRKPLPGEVVFNSH